MADPKYSLGEKASEAYERLRPGQDRVVENAREIAKITIPSLFPPDGYEVGDAITVPNQGFNAHCINTLASRLMVMGLPPHRPAVVFEAVEHKLRAEIEADPELWSKTEEALARKALEHKKRMETTRLRSAYVGAIKQLLIAGNVLWHAVDIEQPVYHRCDSYVVKRDKRGNQRWVALKECVDFVDLDEDVQKIALRKVPDLRTQRGPDRTVDIYTVCKLHTDGPKKVWCYWQEIEGEVIPDTEATAPFDVPQMYAAWLIPVFGDNWGRGYCEDYRGDLFAIENLAGAIQDGAAMASLAWIFNPPGSGVSSRELAQAPNMKVLSGDGTKLSAFRFEKGSDFAFVDRTFETASRRLAFAFLLTSAIQRDAERVTAEEWQRMGQELDEAMGGLYSELAQTFQRHVVLRFVAQHHEDDKDLPELPEDVIRTGVVTGIDALSRSSEGDALMRLGTSLQAVFGPEATVRRLNDGDFARRLATSEAIKPDGLIRKDEDLAAEEQAAAQQMQQAELMKAVAPPIAREGAKAVGQALAPAAPANGAPTP